MIKNATAASTASIAKTMYLITQKLEESFSCQEDDCGSLSILPNFETSLCDSKFRVHRRKNSLRLDPVDEAQTDGARRRKISINAHGGD
jgi:hypothetical protein